MIIDCSTCVMAGPACDDCLVSVLLGGRDESGAQVCDEHTDALRALADTGLVPPLRLLPGAGRIDPYSRDVSQTGS